ncbi:ABC transporter permease [Bacillus carboniphilus]|uniref:ABC transporter permease n=1 Tax=Bacillus carboniphilus TaxID=86663 RepID=A0ABN0VUM2_9BACI
MSNVELTKRKSEELTVVLPKEKTVKERFFKSDFWKTTRRIWRNPSAKIGGFIILVLLVMALFPEAISTHDPEEQQIMDRLQPPSSEHWFGTDEFGRDVYSRVVHGARITLQVGLISVGISLIVGGLLGLLAGYFRGKLDIALTAVLDVVLAFPSFIMALAIIAILGPSLTNAMIAVGIRGIPIFARVVRGTTISIREQDFIMAAKASGSLNTKIIFSHIVPNITSSIIVLITLQFPSAVLMAAGLSFLGLGAQPPSPEWGAMLVSARIYMTNAVWIVNFPGIAILLTVLGFNLLGNVLRDVLDPRLKGTS